MDSKIVTPRTVISQTAARSLMPKRPFGGYRPSLCCNARVSNMQPISNIISIPHLPPPTVGQVVRGIQKVEPLLRDYTSAVSDICLAVLRAIDNPSKPARSPSTCPNNHRILTGSIGLVYIPWEEERFASVSTIRNVVLRSTARQALLQEYPYPAVGKVTRDAVFVTKSGAILAWYFPNLLNQSMQVSSPSCCPAHAPLSNCLRRTR
jgi:hypothetical protein